MRYLLSLPRKSLGYGLYAVSSTLLTAALYIHHYAGYHLALWLIRDSEDRLCEMCEEGLL